MVYKKENVMYVYRETILLAIIVNMLGFICSYYSHKFIMSKLPPNNIVADMTFLLKQLRSIICINIYLCIYRYEYHGR